MNYIIAWCMHDEIADCWKFKHSWEIYRFRSNSWGQLQQNFMCNVLLPTYICITNACTICNAGVLTECFDIYIIICHIFLRDMFKLCPHNNYAVASMVMLFCVSFFVVVLEQSYLIKQTVMCNIKTNISIIICYFL